MPVRIYDISKKLGIENKVVIEKAKELGIKGARVASSTLDKITAEYLEEQLRPLVPVKPTPPPPAPEPPPAEPDPTATVPPAPSETAPAVAPAGTAPETPAPTPTTAAPVLTEPEAPKASPETAATPATPTHPVAEVQAVPPSVELPPAAHAPEPPTTSHVEPAPVAAVETPQAESVSPPPVAAAPTAPSPEPAAAPVAVPVVAEATPALPPPPPAPPKPQIGDKIGFIDVSKFRRPSPPDRDKDKGKNIAKPAPGRQPDTRKPEFGKPGQRGPATGAPAFGQGRGMAPTGMGAGKPIAKGQPAPSAKPAAAKAALPETAEKIIVKPPIVVRDLADKLKRKPFQLIADLMEVGVFANVNQTIDEPVAQRICAKYGFRFEIERTIRDPSKGFKPVERKVDAADPEDKTEDMVLRAPVVTIMGHVDHGKTTLLDSIRQSNVAAGEAGGITQHIGAYTISFPHPEDKKRLQQITFLDTPGHAAFSAMRARGANVTDIVVLVVAANDGVMPQTIEALSHAQAARVPIIVAVNKIDHPNADSMKVRQQLQSRGLIPDDWGGETIFADCSALTKKGVDKLLEMILLQADMLQLKANPKRRAKGNIIESGLEPGGPTATVLVRKGTLHTGDVVVCGPFYGKVRALISEEGKRQKEAGPSVAVRLLGLNGVPEAGIEFITVENDKVAREMVEERVQAARANASDILRPRVTLENLFASMEAGQAKSLKVIVKADTQGSVEAIVEALKKLEASQVSLEIIHNAVGTITESDVQLASASTAIILGFHTRIDVGVSDIAKREGIQIKLYSIIYELIDEVKESMAGLLEPVIKETVIGSAEVRKVFSLSKGGNVAGCVIASGRIVRGKARVLRRKSLLFEGVISSLRRFQDEVNEVRAGMECGIRFDGFNEFLPGDVIESFQIEKIAPKL